MEEEIEKIIKQINKTIFEAFRSSFHITTALRALGNVLVKNGIVTKEELIEEENKIDKEMTKKLMEIEEEFNKKFGGVNNGR